MATTKTFKFLLAIGVVAGIATAPFAVLAQENIAGEAESDTDVSQVSETWFQIEKLSGVVNQGDFVVGPGRVEIEVKPGQTVTQMISIANRISDDRTFMLEVEDVAGSQNAERAVSFLGKEDGPYTIKNLVSFKESSFKLNLGERARVPVTISVPADAEPGGYYGGVLVSTVQDKGDEGGEGTARSPIVARIGTLFFITVPGDITREGQSKELTLTDKKFWYEKGPINFALLYENTGSVHVNPYGELRIRNIFNEEVAFVELEPWFVLPKSLRTREFSWDREFLFGRYTATAYINRGYDDIVDELTVSFWVLPWKVVLPVFLVVFIILFTVRFISRNFEFKRRS